MSTARPYSLLLAAALFGAGLGLAFPSIARGATPPGYRPGESFVFNFSVGSIQAGRARLAVGEPKHTPNGPRVAIHGDAETSPWLAALAHVKDTYKSFLDADGMPATRRIQLEEHGMRERTIDFVLDALPPGPSHVRMPSQPNTRLTLDITRPSGKRHEIHDLPGKPLDLVAGLFFIRFQKLVPGDRFEFVFFDGPMFYRAHAQVLGREQITWSEGPANVVRVDIEAERIDWNFQTVVGQGAEKRRARLRFSDDTDHVPYRIEGDTDFGLCQLELVAYQPGKPPVALTATATPATTGAATPATAATPAAATATTTATTTLPAAAVMAPAEPATDGPRRLVERPALRPAQ